MVDEESDLCFCIYAQTLAAAFQAVLHSLSSVMPLIYLGRGGKMCDLSLFEDGSAIVTRLQATRVLNGLHYDSIAQTLFHAT